MTLSKLLDQRVEHTPQNLCESVEVPWKKVAEHLSSFCKMETSVSLKDNLDKPDRQLNCLKNCLFGEKEENPLVSFTMLSGIKKLPGSKADSSSWQESQGMQENDSVLRTKQNTKGKTKGKKRSNDSGVCFSAMSLLFWLSQCFNTIINFYRNF